MVVLLTTASLEGQHLAKSFFNTGLLGAAGTPTGASDDEFNRVSFLSHFEGSNNGVNNAFDDGSTSNHTITANGNVTQGSFGPFARPDGEWGVSFDGDDYLSVAETGADEFTFGTGDFTIEGWINNQAVDGSRTIVSTAQGNDFQGIWFGINGGNYYYIYNNAAGNNWDIIVDAGTPVLNAWTHFALVRNGTSNVVYINGSSIGSTTETARNLTNTNNLLAIGGRATASQYTISTMSNVRVVKGTAVYTGNFTPSTSKLTAITNTKLLTCQSNRFVDNSASPLTITPVGNPAVTAFGPFLTSSVYDAAVNGASAYFDGSDDLTISNSSDFNLSNNPFTFSFWANFSSGGTVYGRYNYPSSQRETFISCYDTGGITVRVSSDGTGYYTHSTASDVFGFNQWNYIVVTRTIDGSDSIFKTYVNGTLSATSTFAMTTIYNANQSTYIMNYGPIAERPTGFLCDFKLVNGTATAPNSSNPTAPATNTTNTKLLLNMADGQAIDSTAQRNLSLENGTNISTAQAKFGNSSLYFDGTTDTATVIRSENVNFGTANFTVEGWIRPASFSGYKPNIISKWTNGSRGWAVRLVASGSGFVMRFTFSTDGSNDSSLDATTVLAFDTWHHFAFVQNSNTVTCYANGTANGTISCSTIFANTNPIILGDWDTNQADYNGYIDDIRVTTGVARYTSNFTAPTEPFPDKGQ